MPIRQSSITIASGSRKTTIAFLFPWLVNLIFEDRWLLAEQDPAIAAQEPVAAADEDRHPRP